MTIETQINSARFFGVLFLVLAPLRAFSVQDPGVTLSVSVTTNGQVQLVLTGEAGVSYVIETSPDLQVWSAIMTNNMSSITRVFEVDVVNSGFLRARRAPLPIFVASVAATSSINLDGNNLQTDSFDSSDPDHSDLGAYPFNDMTEALSCGDILTGGSLSNSMGVGNARIKGILRYGPNGTIDIGPGGSVGDTAWVEGGNLGIEPGYSANDIQIFYPNPVLPSAWTPIAPIRGSFPVDGLTYDYSLTDGQWRFSNLSGGNFKIHVAGAVQIVVTSPLAMSGNDVIQIGTNASLKIYMQGGSATFGGKSVVNPNDSAASFGYYGLASNTNLVLTITNAFAGTVLSPGADVTIGAGTSGFSDFIGAIVARRVKLNGGVYFHFDENLSRTGPFR